MSRRDSDSQERDLQDDVSTTSSVKSESSMTTDSETEEKMDPWIPLIEEAKQKSNTDFQEMKESLINTGLDEQSAKEKAYSNIMPILQKELENIYLERLLLPVDLIALTKTQFIKESLPRQRNSHSINGDHSIKMVLKSFSFFFGFFIWGVQRYKKGIKQNGVYKIDPDGKGSFNVRCDMTTSGGGWTVFQRRIDGSVDFYRGWQDYKHGFGDLNGEFWLGLEKIRRLTSASQNELRIDMEDTSGNRKYAEYGLFAVTSERQKYQLSLGTYSGNAGDSFTEHKGMSFSTKDSDNDRHSSHCAVSFKGAWWYSDCHSSNLNGLYHHGAYNPYADGIHWRTWKGYHYSLKSTSMKIRPRVFGLKK
ncbi:ficolin-2-like [Dendronephthya gigantea]|uniref:ficolin-2-like n=1 Tax=Dendronephthya gigantea TaxID=151771 RepID=UPI00106AE2C0|nr:ficolin-2-like [Dendronephthya gigantea]